VLQKSEKKKYIKIQYTQKMINEIRTVCKILTLKNGDSAVIFGNLSQLIGLLFLSDSSANF